MQEMLQEIENIQNMTSATSNSRPSSSKGNVKHSKSTSHPTKMDDLMREIQRLSARMYDESESTSNKEENSTNLSTTSEFFRCEGRNYRDFTNFPKKLKSNLL